MTEDKRITLAHGNGGRRTRELIEGVFREALAADAPDTALDAAPIDVDGTEWAMSVDGFTVQPLEFPGGTIGSLAIHGTVNDLAVSGAEPEFLSLSVIIEEGLEVDTLRRIVEDLAMAARQASVRIVCGDTKVVPHGSGGGLYLSTTGIGRRVRRDLSPSTIEPGDRVLVSGPIGDHGVSVMLAREDFDMSGDVKSDSASVLELARAAWQVPGVRFLRDPTRGGLATVAWEIASLTEQTVVLHEEAVPVRAPVRGVCEILGYDPYYLACEGRVVAFVSADSADEVLTSWSSLPGGELSAIIGHVQEGAPRVVLRTELGGSRILDELEDDPLPRIC